MFSQYINEFSALYLINLYNLISPGAGCALMVRNSANYTRKIGIYTAFGIVLSSFFHKAYTLMGFGLVITETPWLFYIIKYTGSLYLCYLGIKTILLKPQTYSMVEKHPEARLVKDTLTSWQAFRMGFVTDLLNPMASFSFFCIVASTVSPTTDLHIRAIYGLILITTSLIWYLLLAYSFSHRWMQMFVFKTHGWVDRIMGGFLIYLGIKLFFRTIE